MKRFHPLIVRLCKFPRIIHSVVLKASILCALYKQIRVALSSSLTSQDRLPPPNASPRPDSSRALAQINVKKITKAAAVFLCKSASPVHQTSYNQNICKTNNYLAALEESGLNSVMPITKSGAKTACQASLAG
ncbi:hypothetical protein [Lonsdalea quercina]|uniref:hypothetical protein n=1 Tax=Lonsdalea quercina TaxID=71657 RepID=UPI00397485BE